VAALADKTTPRLGFLVWFVIVEFVVGVRFVLAVVRVLHGVPDHVMDALRAAQGTVALASRRAGRRR
jgi:predicted small integral membrane protein